LYKNFSRRHQRYQTTGDHQWPNSENLCARLTAVTAQTRGNANIEEYGMQNVEHLKRQLKADVSNAIDRIVNWREFDFKLDGVSCHYEYYCGIQVFEPPNTQVGAEFEKLLDHIHQFQERVSAVQLDPLEVSKIVYKYFQMEAKTMKALRRVRVDVPSVESLSPERLKFLDRLYQDSKQSECCL
jgi:hypothetical protein